jgi:hypothetical protein
VISSPEYNASMPAALKNSIDWVSRFNPQPVNERHALLLSASPSMTGGNRGLWALRVPLEHLGARVYPDMFSLAQAHLALNADGTIKDAQLQQRFEGNVANFMNLVEASKLYPCVKRALGRIPGRARRRPGGPRADQCAERAVSQITRSTTLRHTPRHQWRVPGLAHR